MDRHLFSAFVFLAVVGCYAPLADDQIDRPGIGEWCFDPVRSPTAAEKVEFVEAVSGPAIEAEREWGVPAPILAAMTIVESGFGTTRLAIKSNNILAFKWPGETIGAGLDKFELWCQPLADEGNIYPAFDGWAQAIDFVASRLNRSVHYRDATAAYAGDLASGLDRMTAGRQWLASIAPKYNWKPEKYIPDVTQFADDPLGDGSLSLWSLEP